MRALFLIGAVQIAFAQAAYSTQINMDRMLRIEEVASIRVLSLSEGDFVRTALTPELLLANYRGFFNMKRSAPGWREFEQLTARTTLEESSEKGDHRWAILFRDSAGRSKHTLAIDRKRRLANLDGKAYRIRGPLLSWLKKQSERLVNRQE